MYRSLALSLLFAFIATVAFPQVSPAPASSTPETFKLAVIQMNVVGGDKEANLAHAEELLARAASEGAKVALLPETMDLGWTHPSAREGATPIPGGTTCRRLCRAARRYHLYICSGMTEREGKDFYNAAVFISPEGKVLIHHRKLNEVGPGLPLYSQGDRLSVAHTPLGTFGVIICADLNADMLSLSRSLGYMGADVILCPSAWAVPPGWDEAKTPYGGVWRYDCETISRDFRIWMAAVSNVGPITGGPWKGWSCIGTSIATRPGGDFVLRAPYGEDAESIYYIDVTPERRPTRAAGWDNYWKEHRSKK